MGRGFLSGIFWGGILGVVMLAVSTQVLERQDLSLPQPEARAVEVPGGSEFDQAKAETDPVLPATETQPATEEIASVAVPEGAGDTPPVLDGSALEVPVPTTPQDAPETLGTAPEATAALEDLKAATDAAVSAAGGVALETPESPGDAPVTATIEPDAPDTAPETDTVDVEVTEETPSVAESDVAALAPADADDTRPETTTAPQVSGQVDAPISPAAPDAGETAALETDVSGETDGQVGQAPDAPQLPELGNEPSLPVPGVGDAPSKPAVGQSDVAAAPAAEPETVPEAPDADTAQAAVETETQAPAVPEPEDGEISEGEAATNQGSALPVVRRLGVTEPAEDEDVAEGEAVQDEEAELAEGAEGEKVTGPALEAFASAYENPEALPLLSIVLMHDAGDVLSPEMLVKLPPHLALAIDASRDDASELAAAYRSEGREVVMIPSLPEGATAQDIEQALQINLQRIPEAVAIMDVTGSSFQSNRDAVEQVVEVVAATGHGMITFPRGLNTAHQVAQKAGVPTGLIFRNIDASGATQEQIRRSMDRAAFRARQDEAVILVGSTSEPTLAAISEWSSGNRATTVMIAPVSAALNQR